MSAIVLGAVCVVLLNLYAATLVLLRSRVYGVTLYRPMITNIGLSFAPVLVVVVFGLGLALLTPLLDVTAELHTNIAAALLWLYLIAATGVWLLFFPNSVYLITELNFSHRAETTPVPLWYDIVQTLALTLSGIANAVLSLGGMQTVFIVILNDPDADVITPSSWMFAGIVIVLGAIGVYLGRYLRFNSWDVRHPASMARKLGAHLGQRGKALEAGGFVLTHALLIALLYVPLYALAWSALAAPSR
ncbi:DUF1361 domain-containing protein [Microbacterium sp. bgisy203]|uniref:DUF1361 domain-containing protein n=1 Tax=Microbacterium sp. bgisy203 TaxID=3413799 RepID=UPI003D742873